MAPRMTRGFAFVTNVRQTHLHAFRYAADMVRMAIVVWWLLCFSTPAFAFWSPIPVDELIRRCDVVAIVEIEAVRAGDPPPPTVTPTGDVGERSRNVLDVRVVDVVRARGTINDRTTVDVPWSMSRDVRPFMGPAFRVGERVLLGLVRSGSGAEFRLVADDDGKYLVDGNRYANARLAVPEWRPLSELRATIRTPGRVERGCGGCASTDASSALTTLGLVLAVLSRRRRTARDA
jgi:uncharacterized protein (TIGR03382 family)